GVGLDVAGRGPAGRGGGEGRRLDLGGGGDAQRADGGEQVGGQVEAGERGHTVREGRRLLLRACGGGGSIDRHSRAQALSSGWRRRTGGPCSASARRPGTPRATGVSRPGG